MDGDVPAEDDLVPLQLRVRRSERDAYAKWAHDEERTVAAQARLVLRGAIPVKYLEGE